MKIKFTIITFFLFHIFALAQKHEFADTPKLKDEEVKSLKSDKNPEANAEILYRSMYYYIDEIGQINQKFIDRIKIYKKSESEDLLNKEITIYDSSLGETQNLFDLKAVTYNYENGKVIATKIEKKSKYRSTENKNYNVTKFAFANVKDGSVLEYQYTIISPSNFLVSIPRFVVEEQIPIRYVEYVLDAPKILSYSINYVGDLVPKYRDISEKILYGSDYKVYRFGYEDVPAFKDEKFVLNNDNYKTSIKNELNSTNFNNMFKSYALNWEDIRKRLYESEDFGGQLDKNNLVKDLLPAEIKIIVSESAKASAVLKWMQQKYTWNKEKVLFTNKGIKNLINTNIGDSAEINLLLTLLLRNVGITANPIILATADKGSLLGYNPSIVQPNYVIAAAEIDGKLHLLDATSKLSSIDMIPPRALNYKGILMKKESATIVDIAYNDTSKTDLLIDANFNSDKSFSGKFSDQDGQLFALMANEMYLNDKDEYQKNYKERYKYPLKNLTSALLPNGNFETKFDFTADNLIDEIGNKMVFNPLLILSSDKNSFNQTATRKAPVEFISGYDRNKKVTITLPEGFVFLEVPKSKKFRTDDNSIIYNYSVTQVGNTLTISTTTTVKDTSYPKEYYPVFSQVFDHIVKMEGQLATIIKK